MRVTYMPTPDKQKELETAKEIQVQVTKMVRDFDLLITHMLNAKSGADLRSGPEQPKKPSQSGRG